jgi:uncharacterized membrane protein YbaN (DUF454 family)
MEKSLSVKDNSSSIQRYIYLSLGILLVGIGIVGIILPLLPTTIFLILASACFVKSSPQMNEWLKRNKYLGVYIRNYQDKTGMTKVSKISTILVLWVGILASAYFVTQSLSIRIILGIIAIGVTIHIVTIKTNNNNK